MKTFIALASFIVVGALALSAAAAGPPSTTRVSVSSAGAQGDRDTYAAGISANGRYVVFESDAPNLVAGDTNIVPDAFVRDFGGPPAG